MFSKEIMNYYNQPMIQQLIFNSCRNRCVFFKDWKGKEKKKEDPKIYIKHKLPIKIWKRDLIKRFIDQFKTEQYEYDFFHSVAIFDSERWKEFPNTEDHIFEMRGASAGEWLIKKEYREIYDKEFPNLFKGWDLIFDVDVDDKNQFNSFQEAINEVHKKKAIPLYKLLKTYNVPFTVNISGSKGFRFTILWEDLQKAGWNVKQSQQLSINIAVNLSKELSSTQTKEKFTDRLTFADCDYKLDLFCEYNLQTSVIRAWYSIHPKTGIVVFPLIEKDFLTDNFDVMKYHVKNIFNLGKEEPKNRLFNRENPRISGSIEGLKKFLEDFCHDSGIRAMKSEKGQLKGTEKSDPAIVTKKKEIIRKLTEEGINFKMSPEDHNKLLSCEDIETLDELYDFLKEKYSQSKTDMQDLDEDDEDAIREALEGETLERQEEVEKLFK